jgi:hypothetical protein
MTSCGHVDGVHAQIDQHGNEDSPEQGYAVRFASDIVEVLSAVPRPRGPLYRRAFDSSQHRTSTLRVDQHSTREATRWRPPLPFLPNFSLRWHCDSLTKSAGHDLIDHFCQADRLIVRGFIAGIAATPWKGVCAPTTSSDPESGERRKGNRDRCGLRIARNQPDARARNGTDLQPAVEAVALDSIDVERCVQLRDQRQREVVQRAKPFRIRDTRVGFKGRSFRTPSTHRFIAPDLEFSEYACCSDVVAQSLTLSSKAGRALVIAVTHDDE